MRLYELVLVLKPTLSDADRKKLVEGVKKLVKDMKVTKEDEWGQRPLAYPIKKQLAGNYHIFHLETEATIPADLEQTLLRNEDILRHLLVRTK